jgi:hypothetical protein
MTNDDDKKKKSEKKVDDDDRKMRSKKGRMNDWMLLLCVMMAKDNVRIQPPSFISYSIISLDGSKGGIIIVYQKYCMTKERN